MRAEPAARHGREPGAPWRPSDTLAALTDGAVWVDSAALLGSLSASGAVASGLVLAFVFLARARRHRSPEDRDDR